MAILLLGTLLLRSPKVPGGIYALGLTVGAGIALQAVGIVMVHRANRIINFAQAELGFLGGAIFLELVRGRLLVRALHAVCPPCVPEPTLGRIAGSMEHPAIQQLVQQPSLAGYRDTRVGDVPGLRLPRGVRLDDLAVQAAPGWLVQLNFWLSIVLALGLVVLLSYAVYALVIRRFDRAPRLIATVVTIGLGQVFVFLTSLATTLLRRQTDAAAAPLLQAKPSFPFSWTIHVEPATFHTSEILTVVIAAIALTGCGLFFARSAVGIVLRGASENPDRAETLGVNIGSVNAIVWMLAGGLSGVSSILLATQTGIGGVGGAGIVKYLAAAVVGGLVSLPLTIAAALTIGILDQAVGWSIHVPGAIDGVLLGVVVVVLLFQRARKGRTDNEELGWKAAREARPIPDELRNLDVVRRWVGVARVVGVIAVLGLPWALTPSQTNLATVALTYGIIGLSLLVLTGWAGQISLGHFALAGIGAYVTAVLGWPFPFSVFAGGAVGAAVAVLVGLPALRLRGLHLAISTLAFAVAVSSIVLNPRYLGKALPRSLHRPAILGLDLDDQRSFYYFVLGFLALAALTVLGLRRSRTARALIACRENEAAAQSFGINLLRARLSAFAVSGFLASFAGGLFALSQYGVNLASFGYEHSITMFLMVVIGGTGSIAGPLLGAAYIGIADMLRGSVSFIGPALTGTGVVVLLLFAPGGLGDIVFRVRDAMLRRVADRYRIVVPSLLADRRIDDRRAPISANVRAGGGKIFVPKRYRPRGQWQVEARRRELIDG
jgi:branched-chain amino acid transport system permease protein